MVKLNDVGAIKSYQNSVRHDEGYLKQSKKYKVDTDIVVDAYLAMGSLMFKQVKYNFKKVKEKLEVWKQEQRSKSKPVVLDIISEFPVGTRIAKNVVKQRVQDIYKFYEIEIPVTQTTIENYFKVTPQNNDKPATFVFKYVLPEFEEYYNIFLSDIVTNTDTEPEQEETAKFVIPGNAT
nr:hypothetical protein [uncultured Draconibacterium sp.]